MADISKIQTLDGTTYDLKDTAFRRFYGLDPIETKTYTDVIASANDNNGAAFFYLKVRGNDYTDFWHVKTRVRATIPGQAYYLTDTIFDVWGHRNVVSMYSCMNRIISTSYRAIYYNSVFLVSQTGYNNNCGSWIGVNLVFATNNTNASYKRQLVVDLLEYDNCTVEMQNSLVTPTDIPNRAAHTSWYSSSNTSFSNYDAANYGLKQSGDSNTTTINNLARGGGNYVMDSALYRYQLVFQIDENTLTPLNNANNVTGTTKTMLTDVEFNPFGLIHYYNTTTTVNTNANVGASALAFAWYGVDLRYTFNCGTTLTAHKPLYLTVVPTLNNTCKISSNTPWAQELPTTNDGYWYIYLGRTYSSYQLTFYPDHPVFYHDGTAVRQISLNDILGNATTVNGHTVNSDVPSNAVFTDTTYESKTAASGGTDLSLVTTGEKYRWNTKDIPAGGTAGQVLAKTSNTDYATEWVDQSGGGTFDYDDLTDKPSINNVTLSGNKTAADLGLGTYSKPSGGIPASDLASAVQTSLGKADTALQSVPSTYRTASAQDAIDIGMAKADEVGIVITGNRPSTTVTPGQYVFVRNSTINGISDGLYLTNSTLSSSMDVTAADLHAIGDGGLNSLLSRLYYPVWSDMALLYFSNMQALVDAISPIPTFGFMMAVFTGDLKTDLFNSPPSYGGIIIIYKASANNAYYLAFSREAAAVGNISIADVSVTMKSGLVSGQRSVTYTYTINAESRVNTNLYNLINADMPAGAVFESITGFQSGDANAIISAAFYSNSDYSLCINNISSSKITSKTATIYYSCH